VGAVLGWSWGSGPVVSSAFMGAVVIAVPGVILSGSSRKSWRPVRVAELQSRAASVLLCGLSLCLSVLPFLLQPAKNFFQLVCESHEDLCVLYLEAVQEIHHRAVHCRCSDSLPGSFDLHHAWLHQREDHQWINALQRRTAQRQG